MDSENIEDKVLDLLNDNLELETPITVNHVDQIHRVGAKVSSKPRPVVLIKSTTYRARNSVFRNRRKLNTRTQEDRHEESESAPSQNQSKMYINEDLTKKELTFYGRLDF